MAENETKKITNLQIIQTIGAISRIGGLAKAPKANFALAKNLNRLKVLHKDYTDAEKASFTNAFGDVEEAKKDHPKMGEFIKEREKLLNIEVEFKPHKFASEDLNLELNTIAPADLEAISWLLSDF